MTTHASDSSDVSQVESDHIFPPWFDLFVKLLGGGAAFGGLYVVGLIYFGFSPKALGDTGYMPEQPVPYSHAKHAGQLGLDCRYCHQGVEEAAHAAVPATSTCMNCHSMVGKESLLLEPVRRSYNTGMSVEWIRVHDLPDYVYFNHSAHVRRGVGCVECHGRIDQMEEVYQQEKLSMGWCLDCHFDVESHLRPPSEVTNMTWGLDLSDDERREIGREIMFQNGLLAKRTDPDTGREEVAKTTRYRVLTSCSTCHR